MVKSNYFPYQTIPGSYKYKIFDTTFILVADDFGIKYTSQKNALYLLKCLRQLYRLIIDWKGKLYIGLTLQCDYINRTSDLSVSGYVERSLQQFCSPAKHKL